MSAWGWARLAFYVISAVAVGALVGWLIAYSRRPRDRRCPHHARPPDNGLGYPAWPHPARCLFDYGHWGDCRIRSTDGRWYFYWLPDGRWSGHTRRADPEDSTGAPCPATRRGRSCDKVEGHEGAHTDSQGWWVYPSP